MPDQTPTLAGFTTFCRNVAGISVVVMPDDSEGFSDAFLFAQQWIPCQLQCLNGYLYTSAIYNWGVSLILEFQPDQPGQTYFTTLRSQFKVSNFVPGVVSSTADESTSTTLTVGEGLSNLSLADLQRAQDPFGRRALAILMDLGPYAWGLS